MKMLIATIAVLCLLTSASLRAADPPRGDLLELHSCQLYIGGCIASSEITQGGQYLLRVWHFAGGSYGGSQLGCLQVALLEVADQNLAIKGTQANESMVYLPKSASPAQVSALLEWLKAGNPELARTKCRVRTVPMDFVQTRDRISFSAGDFLQIETVPFAPCGLVSCGEALWYTPRSMLTSYTVGLTSKTVVQEPALALRWVDHGKNNIFQGQFGEGATARASFSPPALVCSAADHPRHE
jgi:hypothetical protein